MNRPSAPAGHVRRARVILLSGEGVSGADIARRVAVSQEHVSRIRRRFAEGGVDGLADQAKAGRKDHAVPAEVVERIVQMALSPLPAGRSRWTSRLLAIRPLSACAITHRLPARRHIFKAPSSAQSVRNRPMGLGSQRFYNFPATALDDRLPKPRGV